MSVWYDEIRSASASVPVVRSAAGAEFVLSDADRGMSAFGANDFPADGQLHGRNVIKQRRPRNRQVHIQAGRQGTPRIKQNSTAREIEGPAGPGVQDLPPPDQLPSQVQEQRISAIRPALSGDGRSTGSIECTHREVGRFPGHGSSMQKVPLWGEGATVLIRYPWF